MDKDELFDRLEEAPRIRWTWGEPFKMNMRFVEFCGDWHIRNSHLEDDTEEDKQACQ